METLLYFMVLVVWILAGLGSSFKKLSDSIHPFFKTQEEEKTKRMEILYRKNFDHPRNPNKQGEIENPPKE